MRSETLLMVADSERDADMLYAVRLFVPDPFIYLRLRGVSYVVMSDLEMDRARRLVRHCRVLSLSRVQGRLRQQGIRTEGLAPVIRYLLGRRGLRSAAVPASFPCGLAQELQALGIRIKPKRGSFFPERECKQAAEARHIAAALRIAEHGLAAGLQMLRRARIGRDRRLFYRNALLTAEKLRGAIESAIVQAGGQASHTIVAPGLQACDPHEPGHGPLRAHEPIILDVFPRSQKTGYYGDITRTVVRGRASEGIRRLYETVRQAQHMAIARMRAGIRAREVHKAIETFFAQHGYRTGRRQGRWEGFFHGTGHGLGLEIHEPPRVNAQSAAVLRPGHVVTVEPGLYYPSVGGARLEDVVWITARGPRNLTRFPKRLEL